MATYFAFDGGFLGLWLRTMSQHEQRKNSQDMRPDTQEPSRASMKSMTGHFGHG